MNTALKGRRAGLLRAYVFPARARMFIVSENSEGRGTAGMQAS
jgi:hypothetical protein